MSGTGPGADRDGPTDAVLHEVFLELASGTRVLVAHDLPDVPAANAVARRWREIAETAQAGAERDVMYETRPGSGCVVRGSSIVAIKAQLQPTPGKLDGLFKVPRPGNWL